MRGLLKQIGDRFQGFLDQRDDLALIVASPETDALPILKIFEGLEGENASDLFWTFTSAFADPASYAGAVVETFAATHGAVRLAMEKEGMAPWPPIPEAVLLEETPPAQRLRALAAFSRELLPILNGGNNVWIFYPLEIADPRAFAGLMGQVLHHEFPFPWCHHLRFIVREDPRLPALRMLLGGAARVDWFQPDLSAEAVDRSLAEETADESLPLDQRMSNVLVMAGNDFAFGRYMEALGKYELLLQYHAPTGNHPMAAVALNGMGEVYEKIGHPDRAEQSYQAALVPASHGDNPPVALLLNVVLNLANLRLSQGLWSDAEAYYDAAEQLATAARDGPTKVRALEYRGVCQQQMGRLAAAERSWIAGSVIAAQLEDVELCRAHVQRLRDHYAATGQVLQERERAEQLAALGRSEERVTP